MYLALKIITATLIATSLMTFFSYIYAEIMKKRFKEPQLLNALISNSHTFPFCPGKTSWIGWLIHYLIGAVFIMVFEVLLLGEVIGFSFLNAVLYGFVVESWELSDGILCLASTAVRPILSIVNFISI